MFYLHETTMLRPGARDEFVAAFDAVYAPAMSRLGARLVALWETLPFSHVWPQTVALWEVDDFRAIAGIGESEPELAPWRRASAPFMTAGEGRVLTPSPGCPTLAWLRAHGAARAVCVHERIFTKPGRQFDYMRALEERYVPWARRNGRDWVGSFTTNWKNGEAILIWGLRDGWKTMRDLYGRQQHIISEDPDLREWMKSGTDLREDWHDAVVQAIRLG
jgi:hypothetical protein